MGINPIAEARADTPDPPSNLAGVSREPAPMLARIPDPRENFTTQQRCNSCRYLWRVDEYAQGTRRRFWWRCRAGYQPIERPAPGLRREIVAPAECQEYRP